VAGYGRGHPNIGQSKALGVVLPGKRAQGGDACIARLDKRAQITRISRGEDASFRIEKQRSAVKPTGYYSSQFHQRLSLMAGRQLH
jgi:hypothetical protein